MIAVLETQADVEKFTEILGEEAKKLLNKDGLIDLKNEVTYATLMSATKVRFRAWQMEQPGYEKTGAANDYRLEVLREVQSRPPKPKEW